MIECRRVFDCAAPCDKEPGTFIMPRKRPVVIVLLFIPFMGSAFVANTRTVHFANFRSLTSVHVADRLYMSTAVRVRFPSAKRR
jgi:hypothetical protein